MKKIYLSLWMVFLAISSFAQKLPDIQTSKMAAPATVKIDGKTTEWNDSFAAENKRTELFYSIANDDKNLYLVLKSSSTAGTNKIMMGGITFLINTDGKKKEKDAITVTYPLIVRANRAQGGRGGQGQNRQAGGQGGFQNRAQQSQQQRDSIALVLHKTQLAAVKEIKISGFKTITDSLISIYNEHGIKAVASFDQKGIYTCEFAIPLNLLGLSASDTEEFAYQIKVNGLSNMNFGGNGGSFGGNGGGFGGNGRGGGGFGGGNNASSGQDLLSPTDFWGKYSLAKK